MRLALSLALMLLLAALAAGCGGGSSSTETGPGGAANGAGAPPGASSKECGGQQLRVTGVACEEAKAVLSAFRAAPGCRIQGGASHASCEIQGYLCITARQGKTAAGSCSRPGHSILFVPSD